MTTNSSRQGDFLVPEPVMQEPKEMLITTVFNTESFRYYVNKYNAWKAQHLLLSEAGKQAFAEGQGGLVKDKDFEVQTWWRLPDGSLKPHVPMTALPYDNPTQEVAVPIPQGQEEKPEPLPWWQEQIQSLKELEEIINKRLITLEAKQHPAPPPAQDWKEAFKEWLIENDTVDIIGLPQVIRWIEAHADLITRKTI